MLIIILITVDVDMTHLMPNTQSYRCITVIQRDLLFYCFSWFKTLYDTTSGARKMTMETQCRRNCLNPESYTLVLYTNFLIVVYMYYSGLLRFVMFMNVQRIISNTCIHKILYELNINQLGMILLPQTVISQASHNRFYLDRRSAVNVRY